LLLSATFRDEPGDASLHHFIEPVSSLNADDEAWDATVFTKNRDRLLEADVAKEFLAQVVAQAGAKGRPGTFPWECAPRSKSPIFP
jgi:hypothetical protein